MTKEFCDLCGSEIHDERAVVSIKLNDRLYQHREYCPVCFFRKSNWDKIHIKPPKDPYLRSRKRFLALASH